MFKLLSAYSSDSKTAKSNQNSNYLTAILYLRPNTKLCPHATKGCLASCLNTAGRGKFSNVQNARLRKSRLLLTTPDKFKQTLKDDLIKHVNYCRKHNKIPCVRLNGTSDFDWHDIISEHQHIQFYDYTKDINKMIKNKLNNYHLTYSYNEKSVISQCKLILKKKKNVAVVFRKEIPETFLDTKVIDGDKTDLRFLDESGVIVGLKAKGKAKLDKSGFVVSI